MVIQAVLVGLVYWLSMGRACYFISFAIRKPVVLGVIIGLIYGDVEAGLMYGAAIQLMYMGGIEAGGNIPSDQGLASCIAIPLFNYRVKPCGCRCFSSSLWRIRCIDQ